MVTPVAEPSPGPDPVAQAPTSDKDLSPRANTGNEVVTGCVEGQSADDELELSRLLVRMRPGTIVSVLTRYLVEESVSRRKILRDRNLRNLVLGDLQLRTDATDHDNASALCMQQLEKVEDARGDREQATASEQQLDTCKNAGTTDLPAKSDKDNEDSIRSEAPQPQESRMDNVAVDTLVEDEISDQQERTTKDKPRLVGGNRGKAKSEEFVYSDDEDNEGTHIWDREMDRWGKLGLGDFWTEVIQEVDRNDEASIMHLRGLVTKAKYLVAHCCGTVLHDFIQEVEHWSRTSQLNQKLDVAAGQSVDGLEQFKRGWLRAEEGHEGAKLVKRAIQSNALADIYEGYFRIGTTEATIVDQSAGISSSTTSQAGDQETRVQKDNDDAEEGLFVSPDVVPALGPAPMRRVKNRRATRAASGENQYRTEQISLLGLAISQTKLAQTLNKSRNYAITRSVGGGPGVFVLLSGMPKSQLESYLRADCEVLIRAMMKLQALECFRSANSSLRLINSVLMECIIAENHDVEILTALVGQLRGLCEVNFEDEGAEESDTGLEQRVGKRRNDSDMPDLRAPKHRRLIRSASSSLSVSAGADKTQPIHISSEETGQCDASLGSDELVGGALMFRYMKLLCDHYNTGKRISKCVTADPNAWEQYTVVNDGQLLQLPKHSVWPSIDNTAPMDLDIDHWFLPIHDESKAHWVMLYGKGCGGVTPLQLEYYDSLGGELDANARRLIATPLKWLQQLSTGRWTLSDLDVHLATPQPRQNNSIDCGVVVMLVAKCKILGQEVKGDVDSIKYLRESCAVEINTGHVVASEI